MEVLVDYSRDYFAREAQKARIERDLLLSQRQQLSRVSGTFPCFHAYRRR